jgi:hypothetical protein
LICSVLPVKQQNKAKNPNNALNGFFRMQSILLVAHPSAGRQQVGDLLHIQGLGRRNSICLKTK